MDKDYVSNSPCPSCSIVCLPVDLRGLYARTGPNRRQAFIRKTETDDNGPNKIPLHSPDAADGIGALIETRQ